MSQPTTKTAPLGSPQSGEPPLKRAPSSSFLKLPPPIVGTIANFNLHSEMIHLEQLSPRVRKVVYNTDLHFTNSSISDEKLKYIIKNHKGPITSITLSNCDRISASTIAWIAQSCPKLVSLKLTECSQLNNADLAPLSSLENLTTLHLDNNLWLTGEGLIHLTSLPQLTTLSLSGCSELTDADLAILKPLKNLQHLNVSWCPSIEGNFLLNFEHLTQLYLDHCENFNGEYLAGLNNLMHLSLVNCVKLENEHLLPLRKCKEMLCLDLTGCSLISDKGLHILMDLPHLTTLNLTWCDLITNATLVYVNALAHLTALYLASCQEITNIGLAYLTLTSLLRLDCSGCDKITSEGIAPFLNMPTLRTLDVGNCRNIKKKEIAALDVPSSRRCKRMRKIVEESNLFESDSPKIKTEIYSLITDYATTRLKIVGLEDESPEPNDSLAPTSALKLSS